MDSEAPTMGLILDFSCQVDYLLSWTKISSGQDKVKLSAR